MKISDHFVIQEFVDPVSYQARGEKSIELIDIRIIRCAELLREITGKPVTVNNWHIGGNYKESGLRQMNTVTGAKYSQHKYGRAADVKVQGMNPSDVRDLIKLNWPRFREAGLTTIEKDTPTWVHLDCRYTGSATLYEVPYK